MQDGDKYELHAARMLAREGLRVLERNYRCKMGEIDIICSENEQLVFVEVRCRHNPRYASAAASVTRAKQRRIIRAAQHYLQCKGWSDSRPCRFDVVAFSGSGTQQGEKVEWLKNAFAI